MKRDNQHSNLCTSECAWPAVYSGEKRLRTHSCQITLEVLLVLCTGSLKQGSLLFLFYSRSKAALIAGMCSSTRIFTTGCRSSLVSSSKSYQPQSRLSWSSVALKEALVSGETAARKILNSFWLCFPRLRPKITYQHCHSPEQKGKDFDFLASATEAEKARLS